MPRIRSILVNIENKYYETDAVYSTKSRHFQVIFKQLLLTEEKVNYLMNLK